MTTCFIIQILKKPQKEKIGLSCTCCILDVVTHFMDPVVMSVFVLVSHLSEGLRLTILKHQNIIHYEEVSLSVELPNWHLLGGKKFHKKSPLQFIFLQQLVHHYIVMYYIYFCRSFHSTQCVTLIQETKYVFHKVDSLFISS